MIYPADTKLVECRRCSAGNRIPLERAFTSPGGLRCGRCKAALFLDRDAAWHPPVMISRGETVVNQGTAYQHPLDRDALAAVHQIPGVDTLMKKLLEHTFERYFRLFSNASFVRAGDGQLTTLHSTFERAAHCLGLTDLPDLFLYTDPRPNAYTAGVQHPFVAVSTGLVDLMDDEEVGAVFAHELAHWQCRHVLYKQATQLLVKAGTMLATATLGIGALVTAPIQLALLKWDRCSELTADRGMLIATRDPALAMRVLFKLAGGSFRLRNELSLDRFIEQAQ